MNENKFAVVLFDFTPSVAEELELNTGDFILVTETVDDFWLCGKRLFDNAKGQFPREFINFVKLPNTNEADVLYFALDTFYPETSDDLHFQKGDVVVCERIIDSSWGCGRCGANRGMFPLNYVQKIPLFNRPVSTKNFGGDCIGVGKAILSLKAQLEEELTFEVGDEILILEELPDGWYKGRLGNNTGIFPAAFVDFKTKGKPVNNQFAPVVNNASNISMESAPNTEVSNGDLKTTPLQGSLSSNEKASSNNIKPASTAIYQFASENSLAVKENHDTDEDLSLKLTNPAIFKVYSVHNFIAGSSTELAFGEGETIDILEEADEHWYIGRLGIRVGYVPRTYVSRTNPNAKAINYIPRHASFNQPKSNLVPRSKKLLHSQSESNIKLFMHQHNSSQTSSVHSSNSSSQQSLQMSEGPRTAEVQFSYVSQGGNDLTINVGDKVDVVQKYDDEWTEVSNKSGLRGIVPTSYIKMLETDTEIKTMEIDTLSKPNVIDLNKNDLIIPIQNNVVEKEKIISEKQTLDYNYKNEPAKNFYTSEPTNQSQHINSIHKQDFVSPKPFQSQVRVHKSIVPAYRGMAYKNNLQNQNNSNGAIPPKILTQSHSIDESNNYRKEQQINIRERRSKSYVNTEVIDKHLHVWQSMYSTSPEKEPGLTTLKEHGDNVYETPIEYNNPRRRTNLRRSASMKEHRTKPRIIPNNRPPEPLQKIRSDSSIKNGDDNDRNHVHEKSTVAPTVSLPGKLPSSAVSRVRGSVSTSTGSSESLNSLTESRNSQSTTYSDSTSGKDSGYHHQQQPQTVGAPPPLPTRRAHPLSTNPISPPPPRRKESLQNRTNVQPPQSPNQPIISSMPPARPAPDRPKPITVNRPVAKPPMRPSNPPRNSVTAKAGSQSLHKMKMEKLRNDIEEYSRMKSDLESLYRGTTDGRERREISENLGFVKTNLKRLQMEFHNLIKRKRTKPD